MMDSDTRNNDFEYARTTYHEILSKGSEAMEEMMELARSTEHPRAFEVLSTMMKTLADVNGDLLDLHKKKNDIDKKDNVPALTSGTTNNNLFVGSTTELQKFLIQQDSPENVIELNDYKKE